MMIANGHRAAALTTDDQSLQQSRPFARRPCFALSTMRLVVLKQSLLVGQELLPTDIAGMGVRFEKAPLFPRQLLTVHLALDVLPRSRASKTECTRVAGIVQGIQGHGVGQFLPGNFSRAGLAAFGKLQALPPKRLYGCPSGTRALERSEEHTQTVLDLLIGIQDHSVFVVIN